MLLTACSQNQTPLAQSPDIPIEMLQRSRTAIIDSSSSPFTLNQIPEDALQSTSEQTTEPLLMAHYMPWFQTPETSGFWGIHWTMNSCNPDQIDSEGQRDICSHYYPLIGTYDSSDDDLLEYHILLMKLSGIDGIIVDWYGTLPHYDWPILKEATLKIMQAFNDAGLKVAIMYEDVPIKVAMERGHITDAVAAASNDFQYLKDKFFTLENYLHLDNQPVVLNFGPSYFQQAPQWQSIFNNTPTSPMFAALAYLDGVSDTSYPWIEWPHWDNYLEDYYAWAQWKGVDYLIGSAYHSFKDYYQEGGWGDKLYELDDMNGQRFTTYLNLNAAHNPDIIQLNTWNDYGEGTMLEPTVETGYTYLEELQAFTGARYDINDLKLATELFHLRKRMQGNNAAQNVLSVASENLLSGYSSLAEQSLFSLQQTISK